MEKELNYLSEKIEALQNEVRVNKSWYNDLTQAPSNDKYMAMIKRLEEEIELLQSILSAVTYFELGSDC
jgi:hypothetical protein